VTVTCLVLSDPARTVLAVRRPVGKALGGCWEFPGGKVEPGETPEPCLRREIQEELGIALPPDLTALRPVSYRYPFGPIRLLPFLARVAARPTIELREHTASQWLAPGEWPTLPWAPADLPICRELVERGEELFPERKNHPG
jgi:8-oxo-dGTP diphosphatase